MLWKSAFFKKALQEVGLPEVACLSLKYVTSTACPKCYCKLYTKYFEVYYLRNRRPPVTRQLPGNTAGPSQPKLRIFFVTAGKPKHFRIQRSFGHSWPTFWPSCCCLWSTAWVVALCRGLQFHPFLRQHCQARSRIHLRICYSRSSPTLQAPLFQVCRFKSGHVCHLKNENTRLENSIPGEPVWTWKFPGSLPRVATYPQLVKFN